MSDEKSTPAFHSSQVGEHDATSPFTKGAHRIQLTPGNVHAQIAAGAALNVSSGFTLFPPMNGGVGYSLRVVLGGGAANPILFTIDGLLPDGATPAHLQMSVVGGAGTYELIDTQTGLAVAFSAITKLTTDVNPGGTVDVQTLDLYTSVRFRAIKVGGIGDVVARLIDDSVDMPWTCVQGDMLPIEPAIVRCDMTGRTGISRTTATALTIGR